MYPPFPKLMIFYVPSFPISLDFGPSFPIQPLFPVPLVDLRAPPQVKNCVPLPAAGTRTQLFSLKFTEPGNCTLAHPCICTLRDSNESDAHAWKRLLFSLEPSWPPGFLAGASQESGQNYFRRTITFERSAVHNMKLLQQHIRRKSLA